MNHRTLILLCAMLLSGVPFGWTLLSPEADDWSVRLELARRQRQRAEFDLATRTLTNMLESETDEARIRVVLLELAQTAEEAGLVARAIQVLGQFLEKFPEDPEAPELLLRQGLLYRRLGAHAMALSKFYAVLTATLNLRLEPEGRYQRLVLVAQTEIAETHFVQGAYAEATELYQRLLRMEAPELNRRDIMLRLLRCYSAQGKATDVAAVARALLSEGEPVPEAQFLLSRALYQLNHRDEALRTVLALLAEPTDMAWARAAGNELANQMYRAGDFAGAVAVYEALLSLDDAPQWRVPVLYQIGLTRERLGDRDAAQRAYQAACEAGRALNPASTPPTVQTVLDLAAWRQNHLAWLQHDHKQVPTPLPSQTSP
ncbi:MAG: tetratricopeptide repeat protein [Verrucomicrobiae bacterium]|nr:tetratricopeptide repeat protein [Verrucomicrobiae bacterium]